MEVGSSDIGKMETEEAGCCVLEGIEGCLLDDFRGDDLARSAPGGEAINNHRALHSDGFFVIGHTRREREC